VIFVWKKLKCDWSNFILISFCKNSGEYVRIFS
jgi:hypothetical protein